MTKKIRTAFLSICLSLALLAGGGAGLASYFYKNSTEFAITYNDNSSFVDVGELWSGDNVDTWPWDLTVNKETFKKLLDCFGDEDLYYNQIQQKAQDTMTAADIREVNSSIKPKGKDILIEIGGLTWEVCYLSTTKSGTTICTLWLANNEQVWNLPKNSYGQYNILQERAGHYGYSQDHPKDNKAALYSDWSAGWYNLNYRDEPDKYGNPYEDTDTTFVAGNGEYPSNMYSTSYIRNVTLSESDNTLSSTGVWEENGSYAVSTGSNDYGTSATTLRATHQEDSSPFVFLNSVKIDIQPNNIAWRFGKYLVTPSEVEWQEKQSARQILSEYYDLYNESWSDWGYYTGEADTAEGYKDANYSNVEHYSDWAYDKIWLPSLSELGKTPGTGIWELSKEQRANNPSDPEPGYVGRYPDSTSPSKNSVTRTAKPDSTAFVYAINSDGEGYSAAKVSYSYAVRPAFHLNMDMLAEELGIPDEDIAKIQSDKLKVDEMFNENDGVFIKTTTQQLFDYVTGTQNATYQDVLTASETPKTAADIKNIAVEGKESGTNIVVRLGGIDWNVVYLSQTTEGHPIVTLWMDSYQQEKFAKYTGNARGAYYGIFGSADSFNSSNSKTSYYAYGMFSTYSDTFNRQYSSGVNLYSNSYIRKATLYDGAFKVFNRGNLKPYIAVPDQVPWQRYQSSMDIGGTADALNEGLYLTGNEKWRTGSYGNASDAAHKDNYAAWGSDSLWIPSMTETGGTPTNPGIWQLSMSQLGCSNFGETYILQNDYDSIGRNMRFARTAYWLRTAAAYDTTNGAATAAIHKTDGTATTRNGNIIDNAYGIRAALHLDLYEVYANLSTWEGYAADGIAEGDGSKQNPYKISSPEEFAYLAKTYNSKTSLGEKYYVQTCDLDMSAHKWNPIALYKETPFEGHYDGQNHKISGVTIVMGSLVNFHYIGLFGVVTGSIERVNFDETNRIDMPTIGVALESYFGGICAILSGKGYISQCKNSCTVDVDINTATSIQYNMAGGICASVTDNAYIEKCQNYGYIHSQIAGGIVCMADTTNKISLCYNYGDVYGNVTSGGLVASMSGSCTIEKCFVYGNIKSQAALGGILAIMSGGTIADCSVYATLESSAGRTSIGHFVGMDSSQTKNAKIERCLFIGKTVGIDNPNVMKPAVETITIDSCYSIVGTTKLYTDGDFSGWAIIKPLNENYPTQTNVYALGNVAQSIDSTYFDDTWTKI